MNMGILKNVFSESPEPLKMILIYSFTKWGKKNKTREPKKKKENLVSSHIFKKKSLFSSYIDFS